MEKGRHTTGRGFEADCEKYDEALIAGWRVLRATGGMVKNGQALAMLERAVRKLAADGEGELRG